MAATLEHDPGRAMAHAARVAEDFTLGLAELRVIDPAGSRPVQIGYFDNGPALIQAVMGASVAACNVYVGVQPRPAHLLERSPNRLSTGVHGASAGEIETLAGMLIDFDPVRAEGCEKQAATDAELAHAITAAESACAWLEGRGFARPAVAMSGNGAQLWFRVPPTSLDTDDREAIEQGLRLFEDEVRGFVEGLGLPVKVDRTSDFARVGKLIGTVSRKGDGKGDRPHRVSRWLAQPDSAPDARLLAHVVELGQTELRRIDGAKENQSGFGRSSLREVP